MRLLLKNVRLSFPDLFIAKPFKPGDAPRFKATFLLQKEDPQIKVIEAAILDTAAEKFGKKAVAVIDGIRGNANRFCFQDGNTKEYEGYENVMALAANSKTRPLVLDRDKTQLVEADGKLYAGCYVNASVEIFAYTEPGNGGISASLKGVQFVRDGDAFGGGAPASPDEFEDLGVDAEADDLLG